MNKLCVITGLTATGKSQLAIDIAKETNAIILSVDSVAVYKELSIASAAPTLSQQDSIPHYGIGIVSIQEGMDVARFQVYALNVIEEAFSQGKKVILVGGSGLYLNAILFDYVFTQTESITHEYDQEDNETLYKMMIERDPSLAQSIHPNNRKRLIRALVLMDELQTTKTLHLQKQTKQLRYPTKIITCDMENRDVHRQLMSQRVDQMIESGLMKEVMDAYSLVDFSHPAMSAIGVKQWEGVFNQSISLETGIELIKTKTHQFAKRQRTWFKHQLNSEWVMMDHPEQVKQKKEECIQWLNNSQE